MDNLKEKKYAITDTENRIISVINSTTPPYVQSHRFVHEIPQDVFSHDLIGCKLNDGEIVKLKQFDVEDHYDVMVDQVISFNLPIDTAVKIHSKQTPDIILIDDQQLEVSFDTIGQYMLAFDHLDYEKKLIWVYVR